MASVQRMFCTILFRPSLLITYTLLDGWAFSVDADADVDRSEKMYVIVRIVMRQILFPVSMAEESPLVVEVSC